MVIRWRKLLNIHEYRRRRLASEIRTGLHCADDLLTPEDRLKGQELLDKLLNTEPVSMAVKIASKGHRNIQYTGKRTGTGNFLDLLAVVGAVAFGIRALFFQPFQIPTGSMQPTLFGRHYLEKTAVGRPALGKSPVSDFLLYGSVKAKEKLIASGDLDYISQHSKWGMPWTRVCIGGVPYELPGTPIHVAEYAGIPLQPPQEFTRDTALGDGFWSLGDHLFVERFSLYLAPVKRGDIMVFSTRGLHDSDGDLLSQSGFYYVKRVAALPGDTVKITGSQLYVKPRGADSFVPVQSLDKRFEKIYSGRGGYQGHQSGMGSWPFANGREYTLPDDGYLMLGDNTAFSKDSRYFGPVPHRNLIGRPGWVFWPFSRRWGWPDQVSALPEPTGEAMYTTFKVMWKQ